MMVSGLLSKAQHPYSKDDSL